MDATLLAMVVQHWVVLVGGWAYAERRLMQAAQTVRKHALHMARAVGTHAQLIRARATIVRCLAAGCRVHRRTKAPSTCQVLLVLTDAPAFA